jgi:hypothetical protein
MIRLSKYAMQSSLKKFRSIALATASSSALLLTACGGGSSTSACADNPTAPIDGSITEVRDAFGGRTILGSVCNPLCDHGGALIFQADGAGGDFSSLSRFAIASVCKNSSTPDTLYVSGTWSDGSKFLNAKFYPATLRIRNMTLPTGGYFYL